MTILPPLPTFTGSAPCTPFLSPIAASTPPDAAQTGASVSPDAEAPLSIQSSDGSKGADGAIEDRGLTDGSCKCQPSQSEGETTRLAEVTLGPSEAYPPAGYTLVETDLLERVMAEVAMLQSWQADYERLLEKERIELLTPPPAFLRRPDFYSAMESR
jgi:hypothetical protein